MKIKQIFKEQYPSNRKTLFHYISNYYYDTILKTMDENNGWIIKLIKKPFEKPFLKKVEEELFKDFIDEAEYYIALNEENMEIGWICISYQKWNNTARLWDIDVNIEYRRKGVGKDLLKFAEGRAKEWNCRALVLECQSSNYPAICFYRKNGYNLSGIDIIAYSNEDIKRCEVRLELGKLFD